MLYRALRPIAWLICKTLFRLDVEGIKNIPERGGVIIAANHSSYLDPVALGAAVPRRIRWVVRKDVFDVWWLKWLFILCGMIRENGSVEKAVIMLKKGEAIGVFPEGTRSPDGKLGEVRKGLAIMALMSGAPVVPCAVRGAFEAYPRGAVFPRPRSVSVVAGEAVDFEKTASPDEPAVRAALDRVAAAIRSLMG